MEIAPSGKRLFAAAFKPGLQRQKPAKKHGFIPSLNGLRAISILLVIAYHFNQNHFFPSNSILKVAGPLLLNGKLGVNIFFVISGFLITTLLLDEKQRSGTVSLRNFYLRRTVRIFPAYYIFVLVLFVLQVLHYYSFPLMAWFGILTYTKQMLPDYGHAIEHVWSLSTEEFFYLVWPICFLRVKNTRLFLLASICLFVLLRYFCYQYPLPLMVNSIVTTGDALLIGCLAAVEINFFKSIAKRFEKWLPFTPLFIYASVIVYNYAFYLGDAPDKQPALLLFQKLAYALCGSIGLATNLLIAVFMMYCIYSKGLIFRLLNTPVLNYVGLLSYSIYLWQQVFTDDRAWLHRLPLPVLLGCIFLVAQLSYTFVEKPFLKLKRRFETPANPTAQDQLKRMPATVAGKVSV